MANHTYWEFHQQLQWAEENGVQQMTAKKLETPLLVSCSHCGGRVKILGAELQYWPGRGKGREHGWVAVCPVCGTRMVPAALNQASAAPPVTGYVPPAPPVTPPVPPVPPASPEGQKKTNVGKLVLCVLLALLILLLAGGAIALGKNLLSGRSGGANGSANSVQTDSGTDDTAAGTDGTDNAAAGTDGTDDAAAGTDETEGQTALNGGDEDAGAGAESQEDVTEPAKESYYEVFVEDISWSDAMAKCAAKTHNGVTGHLATITSAEEYEKVVEALEEYCGETGNDTLNYVWLGAINDEASCKSGVNNFAWITGEVWSYDKWCSTVTDEGVVVNEPSFVDEGNDNTIEQCLALWGFKHDELGWTFSDQNGELPEVYPSACGKIGYICEYDESEQVETP